MDKTLESFAVAADTVPPNWIRGDHRGTAMPHTDRPGERRDLRRAQDPKIGLNLGNQKDSKLWSASGLATKSAVLQRIPETPGTGPGPCLSSTAFCGDSCSLAKP